MGVGARQTLGKEHPKEIVGGTPEDNVGEEHCRQPVGGEAPQIDAVGEGHLGRRLGGEHPDSFGERHSIGKGHPRHMVIGRQPQTVPGRCTPEGRGPQSKRRWGSPFTSVFQLY